MASSIRLPRATSSTSRSSTRSLATSGTTTIVDPAQLQDKKVTAEVVDQHKGEKVLVFKLKKRKRYHRTKGHRQNLTRLQVVEIPA